MTVNTELGNSGQYRSLIDLSEAGKNVSLLQRDPEWVLVSLPEGGNFLLDEVTGKILEVGPLAISIFTICEKPISLEDCYMRVVEQVASHTVFENTVKQLMEEQTLRFVSVETPEHADENPAS